MIDISKIAEQAVEDTGKLMIMHYKNYESALYKRIAELIVDDCISKIESCIDEDDDLDKSDDWYHGWQSGMTKAIECIRLKGEEDEC